MTGRVTRLLCYLRLGDFFACVVYVEPPTVNVYSQRKWLCGPEKDADV